MPLSPENDGVTRLEYARAPRKSVAALRTLSRVLVLLLVLVTLGVILPDLHNTVSQVAVYLWGSLLISAAISIVATKRLADPPRPRMRGVISVFVIATMLGGRAILGSANYFGADPHVIARNRGHCL